MSTSLSTARPQESHAATAGISPESVLADLDKILSSAAFKGAKGQSNFLRYVVEEALAGRGVSIKEYSIGVQVFGRGETFDPRLDNIVRVEAQRVRSKLVKYYEVEGNTDALRIDLPKGGYVPCWVQAPGFAPAAIPADLEKHLKTTGVSTRKALMLALGAAALFVAAVLIFQNRGSRLAARADARSVAVLPFANLSDDREDEYFADGLSQDLTDSLARLPGLRVVARRSASQYSGKRIDIREIGRVLGVRTVVEGSVRKMGSRLRVTAQLIDATNGYQLWAESYERQWSDALVIQQEISRAITASLGVELTDRLHTSGLKTEAAPAGAEVYRNLLKGRYFWNKNTVESVTTGIRFFEQAIAQDPNYAPAYIGLARCYTALPALSGMPPKDVIPKMRAAALKAIELDPSLGEAHMDLAEVAMYEFDWRAAKQELQKALQLTPGEAVVHRWYVYYLGKTGDPERMLAEARKALELDPVSPYMAIGVAESLYALRRYGDSIEEYRKAGALDSNFAMMHAGLGQAYAQVGMYAEAISEFQAGSQNPGDSLPMGFIGYAHAKSGNSAEARRILDELLKRAKDGPVPALGVAAIYIGLGEKDHAFTWLQKAAAQHEVRLSPKMDPMLDPLRSDARFLDLLRQVRLM